jgi:hypothetical protein
MEKPFDGMVRATPTPGGNGTVHTVTQLPKPEQEEPQPQKTEPQKAEPQRRRKRYFAAGAGEPFFSVPTRLFAGGYAARLSPAAVVRYVTYLRLSNYSYGSAVISLPSSELTVLDGVSKRSAPRILRELSYLGLIRVIPGTGKGHSASVELLHPWRWHDFDRLPKPRLHRNRDGSIRCSLE